MLAVVCTLLAYLAGSIPTGVLLGRIAGVDVRAEGSGNIGATNVARTAGRGLGVLTLIGDLLKGLLPVVLARSLDVSIAGVAAVALAAVCGHLFSIFLGFQGGKGVATGVGALLALAPAIVPIPLAVFIAAMGVSRIVSLSSILASIAAPLALFAFHYPAPTSLAGLLIATLIVWRHQENISRLLAGMEPRFGEQASRVSK